MGGLAVDSLRSARAIRAFREYNGETVTNVSAVVEATSHRSLTPLHVYAYICAVRGGERVQPLTLSAGEVNRAGLKDEMAKGEKPLLVEFYAPWCDHCKKFKLVYEEICFVLFL